MKEDNKIKVGITHGDINGIGYEVILKAIEDPAITELCTPVIYGSAKIAQYYRKALDIPGQLRQVPTAEDARAGECSIINVVDEDTKLDPGQSTAVAGQAAFAALERAVADLQSGAIDVLVTAPINKHNIQSDTFHFPGHTEYLEASLSDGSDHALMILCCDNLRVALVTTHAPIASLHDLITKELVAEKISALNSALIKDFGITAPRIAVLALNPHAGENGLLGKEEQEVIIPAIDEARANKITVFGPYASDGFFGSGAFSKFDGVLAMYHDQGLAPFKALAMDRGVNFTAGLSHVRTSPDHGTGYDITCKGIADATSMREAIYTAIDCLRTRRRDTAMRRNPLRKQYYEKGRDNVVLDLTSD
ncbi:MAG: 4-hydroxythreonine-4-phosphate dehydrogenase PdxA [Muribaculaceae bacterium]|nr:4-hydroxythreonine-4-phosphate dehydrogenase PdxA [Muribaculaceae bacterium]